MSRLKLLIGAGLASLVVGTLALLIRAVLAGAIDSLLALALVAIVVGFAALNIGSLALQYRFSRDHRSTKHSELLLRNRTRSLVSSSAAIRASVTDLSHQVRSIENSVPDRLASIIIRELDHRHLESLKALELIEERVATMDQRSTRLRERVVESLGQGFTTEALSTQIDREVALATSRLDAIVRICSSIPLRRPLPPFGGWAIAPDMASELVDLVLVERPKSIVEVGSGLSTILLGYALEMVGEGDLLSLEHDRIYLEKTVAHLETHALTDVATVVLAPLANTEVGGQSYSWYRLDDLHLPDEIDMLFVDGPPAVTNSQARYPALPLLGHRLSPTAVVILDDTDREEEQETVRRWHDEYDELTVTQLQLERGATVFKREFKQ